MIHNIQADPLDFGNYGFQMASAMDKGEAVEGFVIQVTKKSTMRVISPTSNCQRFSKLQ
jgi:hypothetical protein